MLKVRKEVIKKSKIELEIDLELKKELESYLKVAKHFKYADKTTNLNDIIEEALKQLVNTPDYKKLKSEFEPIDKEKKEKMAKSKSQQRLKTKEKTDQNNASK